MKKIVSVILLIVVLLNLSIVQINAAYTTTNDGYTVANYARAAVGTHKMSRKGLCQTFAWECLYDTLGVSNKAGCGCCATKAWQSYGVSSSRDDIPLGAAVYFGGSSTIDSVCGQEAGHVGIYIGNNEIAHAWSSTIICKTTIDYVINCGYYYRGWGWQGGYALATEVPTETEAPTFATLSTNKESYNINENVTFTFNADNNAKYTLAIYKGDTRIDTIEVKENTYTRTFVESGMYTAYITAYNDAGYKDSNWIGWEIKLPEPPSNISFSTNKTQYSVGETVKFLCNATNANGYTIAIYKDANRVYQGDIPSSFSKTFTEKGNYSAYISAWNSYGLIDSKRIYFTVYDTAPINCTLTVNKSIIYSGNKIIFTANANYANGYTIGIYKNGERIYTGDIDSVFEKTFDDVGNYSAYVTAWNNIGLVDSKRVFFNVEALSECKLEINKTVIRTNENITFSCQAENATGYTIGIDKDGIRICTESIEKICTKSFTQAGNYYAYVTAWNSQGISDSNSVRFVVYDTAPQSSELLIDKTSIAVGDSINFTCNSPQATGYTIGIYKNGTRIFTSDIDKNFTKQFSETGEYSAYVTAWNAIGICDSKRVTFEVYNAIPDSCSIVVDKQKVEVGGVVNLKFDAHNAKLFEIVTYINGEQVWITPSRGNYKELELEIKDFGIYEVWATAYNEYGYCNSEHITFIAYNNDNAVVLKNNNSVRIVKKLNINYNGYSCIIALYDGRRLVKCVNKLNLNGNTILDETILCSDKYDEIKVMNWNNLSELMPLCEAEVIPSSEFIIE